MVIELPKYMLIRSNIAELVTNVDFKGRSYKNLTKDKVKEILDTVD